VTGEARSVWEADVKLTYRVPFLDDPLDEAEARGEAIGEVRGEARGKAEMLLRMLRARGLAVSARTRARVLGCQDLALLDQWGERAETASTLTDVFGAAA
jgi:hypothetical protein